MTVQQQVVSFILLFLLCLSIFFLSDKFTVTTTTFRLFAQVNSAHYILKALFYVFVNVLIIFSFVCMIVHRSIMIRFMSFGYLLICLSIQLTLLFSKGHGFTINEAFLFFGNVSFLGDAYQEYYGSIILSILVSIGVVAVLAYIAYKLPARIQYRSFFISPFAALFLAMLIINESNGKVSTFPIIAQLPVNLLFAYHNRMPFEGVREEPFFLPTSPRFAKHILLIVDESVRGDLLTINRSNSEATPFLKSISRQLINYGIASSPANHSNASNIIIQSGVQLDQLPDKDFRALKNPNIFSYMKNAGYRVYLVNNQLLSPMPTNNMSVHDIADLDDYVITKHKGSIHLNYEVDIKSIKYIKDILDSDEPTFTYLVKLGAHFPYQKGYPHGTQSVFLPDIEDKAELRVDRERTTNTYLNAVRWNVDVFFEKLITALKDRDVLIVYTSDHGQSLLENTGENPSRGHGTGLNPSIYEATVPLVLMPMNSTLQEKLTLLFNKDNVNKTSGFELFPTLLYLAGYAKSDINKYYGKTIFDSLSDDKRMFISGNVFGMGNAWLNPYDIRALDRE